MKGKIGKTCIVLGAVLLAMALALLLYNTWEAKQAELASAKVQKKIENILKDTEKSIADESDDESEREMTVVNIDGYDYIGYLSIPSISLNLPIMSQWSYEGLHVAPGRFAGTTFADNLVIAGHNYARHFSPIKWLDVGTEVIFTDMDGVEWHYTITALESLEPTQVEDLVGKKNGDDWDLTLFTCNTGGQTRCAVRCQRIQ